MDNNIERSEIKNIADNAGKEWEYTEAESDIIDETFSCSIPCQLEFTEDYTTNTDLFCKTLESYNYSYYIKDTRKEDGFYLEMEVISEDNYNRIRLLIFRKGKIRIYPLDDYVPSTEELTDILMSITVGFNSEVKHKPIE